MELTHLDHTSTVPLRGRDVQFESKKSSRRTNSILESEIPLLHFEKDVVKKKTKSGTKGKSFVPGVLTDLQPRNQDGIYAIRFSDSTWSTSTADQKEIIPTREYVRGLKSNYEKNMDLISGYKGVDRATRVQAINDLMLDELVNQLRVINLGQAELLEKSRESFAEVFDILYEDAAESRKEIIRLTDVANNAIKAKEQTLMECKFNIEKLEAENNERIQEMEELLKKRTQTYDDDMKTFIDQKKRLEDHVRALHQVFLDFQSDTVYLKLEELKQQLSSEQKKVVEKQEEIAVLQIALNKWKELYEQQRNKVSDLEEVNAILRSKLQDTTLKSQQYEKQIDILKATMEESSSEEQMEADPQQTSNDDTIQDSKEITSNEQLESLSNDDYDHQQRQSKGKNRTGKMDTMKLAMIYQRVDQLGSIVAQYIEKTTEQTLSIADKNTQEDEQQLLQGDPELSFQVINKKFDDVTQIIDCLNNIETATSNSQTILNNQPRFLSFFSSGIAGKPNPNSIVTNFYHEVRALYNAKYLSDKWNRRSGKPLQRFPDFILDYYFQEEGKFSYALHRCRRLYDLAIDNNDKCPEAKMFNKFMNEEYTTDELSCFLEFRYMLIGIQKLKTVEDPIIRVQFSRCKELLTNTLGCLSTTGSDVSNITEKFVDHGLIDCAEFLQSLINYYSQLRRQRREAVRIMVNSKRANDDANSPILIETFVSIMQALNYEGSFEDLLTFHRYAAMLGEGEITVNSINSAMDQLGIHFYSLDIPLTRDTAFEDSEASRQMLFDNWLKLGQWFEGLNKKSQTFEPWAKRLLMNLYRRTEQSFQLALPAPVMYFTLRDLLDSFQYILCIISRGSNTPHNLEFGKKQLRHLEDLCDSLLNHILDTKP